MDAIVGGGSLVQLPSMFLLLPHATPATILGTNKMSSICGTTVAAINFVRHHRPQARYLVPMAITGFVGSFIGAHSVSLLPPSKAKPLILLVLVVVWIYTWTRKDFGHLEHGHPTRRRASLIAVAGGSIIGFYDGLVGPGTGSFLLFLLIAGEGATFMRASVTAKVVNVMTNLGGLIMFAIGGHVFWKLGALMAVCNMAGGFVGSRIAINKGSRFIRHAFLLLVVALIIRLAFDVF